jgi:predicted DNA-binding transcriptional regulator AlpA
MPADKSQSAVALGATIKSESWFSKSDLAKRYRVNQCTIWRWVRRGVFPPPVELGPNIVRWSPEVVLAHEASRPTVEWAGQDAA